MWSKKKKIIDTLCLAFVPKIFSSDRMNSSFLWDNPTETSYENSLSKFPIIVWITIIPQSNQSHIARKKQKWKDFKLWTVKDQQRTINSVFQLNHEQREKQLPWTRHDKLPFLNEFDPKQSPCELTKKKNIVCCRDHCESTTTNVRTQTSESNLLYKHRVLTKNVAGTQCSEPKHTTLYNIHTTQYSIYLREV